MTSFFKRSLVVCGALVVACSGKKNASSSAAVDVASSVPPPALPDTASLDVQTPRSLAPGERRPFVLLLHGYGADGNSLLHALGIPELAERKRFLYAAPDGDLNHSGQRFWNAGAACCDVDGEHVDHVARVRGWVATLLRHPQIDPQHIFLVGFSNGGFLAHRAACEVAGIAAIASLAGAGPIEPCHPPAPVAVLEVHGDADAIVRYEGGRVLNQPRFPPHPSARETVRAWAQRNGGKGDAAAAGTLDLDATLPGAETERLRFADSRRPVELWTVHGGGHGGAMGPRAEELVFDFLQQAVAASQER